MKRFLSLPSELQVFGAYPDRLELKLAGETSALAG
jgi:hypothetical protein